MGLKSKMRQKAKNKTSGKYKTQFSRTVNRTGRWRGKVVKGFELIANLFDKKQREKKFKKKEESCIDSYYS